MFRTLSNIFSISVGLVSGCLFVSSHCSCIMQNHSHIYEGPSCLISYLVTWAVESFQSFFLLCRSYVEEKGWWSDDDNEAWKIESLKEIMRTFEIAEKTKKPPVEALFSEVYHEWTPRIKRQYEETMEHISKYPNEYPVGSYKMWEKKF